MRASAWWVAGLAAAMATPAIAADETVSAADPAGMVRAMQSAGYPATLDTDDYGDPNIATSFGDFKGAVYFYGCDETTHVNCTSVQFRVGLDRAEPLPLDELNAILKKYRYAAIWLDNDGDPWVNFDVFLGAGVPKSVFLGTLDAFKGNFATISDAVFAEERGK